MPATLESLIMMSCFAGLVSKSMGEGRSVCDVGESHSDVMQSDFS